MILFLVSLVSVSVKHVKFKSERKDDFTDVFVQLGDNSTNGASDHIDILENFMFQLNGLGHGTLDAAPLEKLKKSTDNDLCLLPPSKETLSQRI